MTFKGNPLDQWSNYGGWFPHFSAILPDTVRDTGQYATVNQYQEVNIRL